MRNARWTTLVTSTVVSAVFWIFFVLFLCRQVDGAPISYPVPGGTAYRSNTGQIAVDPGDTQQTFNFPAMGMFGNKFIPIAVDALGEVVITGGSGPGSSNVNVHDFAGTGISSTMVTGKNGLDVNVIDFPSSFSVTQGTSPWVVGGSVSVSNFPATQNVNVTNSTLAVTQSGAWLIAATQSGPWTTGRTWTLSSGTDSVSASVSNFPALQQVDIEDILGSAPSVTNYLPARISNGTSYVDPTQIRALTTSDQITAFQGGSWTVTANAGTGTFQTNVTNSSIPVTQSGTWTVQQGTPPWSVSQSGTWTTGRTWTLASGTDSVTAVISGTVPISGTVTSNQGAPNTLANAWPVEVTDGTNVLGTSAHPVRVDPTGTTTQPVSGTVTANQGGAWTVAATQSGAWTTGRTWSLSSSTDSVASVQSGSWTVTANIGTTGGLALDTSVNGILVAQGSTTSGEKGPLIQGAVTTAAPSYTTAQTSPLSLTLAGALRTDSSATTQPISGTVTSNQGTSPWVTNVSQFGGSNVVTGTGASGAGVPRVTVANDSNILATQSGTWTTGRTWTLASGTDSVSAVQSGTWTVQQGGAPWSVSQSGTWTVQQGSPPWTIQGDSASGAAKAGNPTQIGGVFNTTQPTVITGQTVEAQSTARGAHIVATGVDAFNVNATQTTSPWVSNVTQFGSSNVVTGTGASGAGIPRVTVSNDSNVLATQSGNWTVQQGTPPWQIVGNVASGSADSGNPVKDGAVFNSTLPTVTTGQRVDNQADANGRQIVANTPLDGSKVTCRAAFTGLATATLATDIFTIQGSGTKTIKVIAGELSATLTTANQFNLLLIKRSTANTGGTSSTLTNVPLDSNDAACTASVKTYTANPTALGSAVGTIEVDKIFAAAAGANTTPEPATYSFGNRPSQALTLRGTAENGAFNLNGVTLAGSSFDGWIEWTEE